MLIIIKDFPTEDKSAQRVATDIIDFGTRQRDSW